ncbi:RHS repeat-associated core domain-containing protein, partial [Pseudomonas sp. NY15372]|uniref:RHS repeat-associated core domain-containing protein n=1 Tax=Pseudomonas sp. NY15372 TaxID=3400356 RepID=UPI003A893515
SQEEYYPFGGTAVWAARNEVEARFKTVRYSGKERDATGLYYYGYRYYQPWIGRWLSTDPAGTVDGLNLYRMVKNNPVTRLDEQGLMESNANEDVGSVGYNTVTRKRQKNKQPVAERLIERPSYALKDDASESLKRWVKSRNALAEDANTEAYGKRQVKKPGSKTEWKPVFLLTGWAGKAGDKSKGEGWKHIRENHSDDFKEVGVRSDRDMKELVIKAVTLGELVGEQGKAHGRDSARPIYKVGFKTRTHYIAVSTSPDGSIIGANPNDEKYIEAGLLEDVLPSTRRFYNRMGKDGPQRMANFISAAKQKRTSY